MRSWGARRLAYEAGASLTAGPEEPAIATGPGGVVIDSRAISPGDLFVGLHGEHTDGGEHAVEALLAGARGVLVSPEHAEAATAATIEAGAGVVLVHPDPLTALQALARAWRRELGRGGAKVVGITGSTGKTSTKDILAALLSPHRRTVASPENFNTEIGLPLALLAAPAGTEVLVLEMAMRGGGQIAELARIAEPDVGVIVNVGPVHLELLGTLEAIAAAKAELIVGLPPGATAVIPAGEPLLTPHMRAELDTVTFGDGGEVALLHKRPDGSVLVRAHGEELELHPSFAQEHNLRNLLAAVAAALALGVERSELGGSALQVRFSALRGERLGLPSGAVLVNDCYNANPMSMRAAIDDLAATAPARRVAVLGDMLELGPESSRLHREIGLYAADRGIDLLVSVGPLAAEMRVEFEGESYAAADAQGAAERLAPLLRGSDTVLVKGSRGVGLERVAEVLGEPREQQAS